jgi:hypothetical protein
MEREGEADERRRERGQVDSAPETLTRHGARREHGTAQLVLCFVAAEEVGTDRGTCRRAHRHARRRERRAVHIAHRDRGIGPSAWHATTDETSAQWPRPRPTRAEARRDAHSGRHFHHHVPSSACRCHVVGSGIYRCGRILISIIKVLLRRDLARLGLRLTGGNGVGPYGTTLPTACKVAMA